MPVFDNLTLLSGNAHPDLAAEICSYLGIMQGKCEVFKFSNDNTFVRIRENIRERDVFLVQPFSYPVNDTIMEFLIMVDAAKRASAGRITAVIPYYTYARTDKKDQPRVPITARLIADLLTTAGTERVLTVDLHAGQIQGFFNIPVDELSAVRTLAQYFQERGLTDLVVVATDVGLVVVADLVQQFLERGQIERKRRALTGYQEIRHAVPGPDKVIPSPDCAVHRLSVSVAAMCGPRVRPQRHRGPAA
mgnify:CR=1 FL=1